METNLEKTMYNVEKTEKKATEQHKRLANFIKGTHGQLRNNSKIYGAIEAWKRHIAEKEKLKEYAECMHKLATQHWTQNSTDLSLNYSRIEWIKNQIKNYFLYQGVEKFDNKEISLMKSTLQEQENIELRIKTSYNSKLDILDVGSCYNPFENESFFNVTPIDIAPYSEDVIKCDFLNLKVDNQKTFSNDGELIELPKNSFDAVIFSLLLEYIPCPKLRFSCCQKAFDLLKYGGILLIITPDSKHQGANTKIINTSWKATLSKVGFMRTHYEKLPHIHCLIFRKCFFKKAAIKRIDWRKICLNDEVFTENKIFIPQDFQSRTEKDSDSNSIKERDDKKIVSSFMQLPFND
ncbi:probable methyltransferase BMT2 homolog [Trichogramma pretiosum]|uniref:probable methyltransferase BMT2 homolog n=1 Tax=Trichogramma pretiosum TaxID=7493 RepID=UPI0006C98936|nr:probable methyltransferase BMT2 homolog [Trichogramma pretiosum]